MTFASWDFSHSYRHSARYHRNCAGTGITNLQTREDLARHRAIQGIELLGAVELDRADSVDGIEQDIIGLISGLFFGHLRPSGHLLAVSRAVQMNGKVGITVADAPNAGLVTFARRGMVEGASREVQLAGVCKR